LIEGAGRPHGPGLQLSPLPNLSPWPTPAACTQSARRPRSSGSTADGIRRDAEALSAGRLRDQHGRNGLVAPSIRHWSWDLRANSGPAASGAGAGHCAKSGMASSSRHRDRPDGPPSRSPRAGTSACNRSAGHRPTSPTRPRRRCRARSCCRRALQPPGAQLEVRGRARRPIRSSWAGSSRRLRDAPNVAIQAGVAHSRRLSLNRRALERWADFDKRFGILEHRVDVQRAFAFDLAE
jgi:hypothetical protein